ncbi:MAG: signal peptide peptidase SppA [Candidatus Marinimicrobia bacterium]|nr:signal peptide peptidase SppA [Candidatus Neomarinimicrobiota bacterium]|tara:strand:- start:15013 stop:15861 length:849 start_codon:yes stop_codon:yes gene_type:complete
MILKYLSKKNLFILLSVFILFLITFNSNDINENSIAVVNIDGVILESGKFVKALDKFNKDANIKAIILRINSPGGSVAPSQEIYEKINQLKLDKKKPIVTSVSNVAASGGYYIAIGSDLIVTNPGSIVGSIGVIMSYPITKNLFNNLGIDFNTYKSGEYKDSGSPYRYNTENDDKYFNEVIEDLHGQFVLEVSRQRNIPLTELKEYAQGQIFTGNQAMQIGLVDRIGTFEDALNISKNLANISGDIDLVYPEYEKYSFLNNFINFYDYLSIKNYLVPMFIMN